MVFTIPQHNVSAYSAAAASNSATFSAGIAAGSTILCFGTWFDNSNSTVTWDDGHGDPFTDSGVGVFHDTTSGITQFEQAGAFIGATTGATKVTTTFSGTNPSFASLFIIEVAGHAAPAFDKVVHGSSTGTTYTSPTTGTLSNADEACAGFAVLASGNNTGVTAGWSQFDNDSDTSNGSEGQVVTVTTAIQAGFTSGTSNVTTVWCVTMQPAATAAKTPYQTYFQQFLASKRKSTGWVPLSDPRWRKWRRERGIYRKAA